MTLSKMVLLEKKKQIFIFEIAIFISKYNIEKWIMIFFEPSHFS